VRALEAARRRGVTLIALTDSELSPLARLSSHALLLRTESPSFFPSMVAPLALVEVLLAALAARGGKKVLRRLADVDARLAASQAYWTSRPKRPARLGDTPPELRPLAHGTRQRSAATKAPRRQPA
jgi:fructoselysine-6-P-deglycase FrlB-like protein